jgi:hypothetical protein
MPPLGFSKVLHRGTVQLAQSRFLEHARQAAADGSPGQQHSSMSPGRRGGDQALGFGTHRS